MIWKRDRTACAWSHEATNIEIHPLAYESAQNSGHKLVTAAELVGMKNNPLECLRQKLYEDDPLSREFMKWTKLPREERRVTNPPV